MTMAAIALPVFDAPNPHGLKALLDMAGGAPHGLFGATANPYTKPWILVHPTFAMESHAWPTVHNGAKDLSKAVAMMLEDIQGTTGIYNKAVVIVDSWGWLVGLDIEALRTSTTGVFAPSQGFVLANLAHSSAHTRMAMAKKMSPLPDRLAAFADQAARMSGVKTFPRISADLARVVPA